LGYNNPTLIEIYSEIFLEPGSLAEGRFFDVVPKLKEVGFSEIEMTTAGFSLELEPGQGLKPKEKPRIRCWKPGKREMAQVGEDLVVVNLMGKYPGWDSFLQLFEQACGAVQAGLGAIPARSLSLRTIDRFSVAQRGFLIEEYLQVGGPLIPSWYADCQESMDVNIGRGYLQHDGRNRVIVVSVRTFTDPVTIEMQGGFHYAVKEGADVKGILKSLHAESNATFESIVTDRTRIEVMGGRKE
jgi:uncharacterized protein (TIGR04255 family)